jgi:hypothetical protein
LKIFVQTLMEILGIVVDILMIVCLFMEVIL